MVLFFFFYLYRLVKLLVRTLFFGRHERPPFPLICQILMASLLATELLLFSFVHLPKTIHTRFDD